MSEHIDVQIADQVATITLNRPEARNALTARMLEDLAGAISESDQRADVNVLVITGSDPAFCAGLDLGEMASTGANFRPSKGRPWPLATKPLIGAINGAAITGGLELALACDFLVASERARFGDTHTRVGIVPFWGMTVRLPQAVGLRYAKEMSFTGNLIDASEALRVGLVNRVVAHDDLLPVTMALAHDVASADGGATQAILAAYRRANEAPDAFADEVAQAEDFLSSFDPLTIEDRRRAIMARNTRPGS